MTAAEHPNPLLSELGPTPRVFRLALDDDERAAAAERLGAVSVDSIAGDLSVSRRGSDVFVRGKVESKLVRSCVTTLQPVVECIEDAIELRLTPEVTEADEQSPEDVDLLAEPFLVRGDRSGGSDDSGGRIDLVEILVQQTALAMAPFPHVDASPAAGDAVTSPDTQRPFAGLKELLDRKGRGD